jgi:hypothetical protein
MDRQIKRVVSYYRTTYRRGDKKTVSLQNAWVSANKKTESLNSQNVNHGDQVPMNPVFTYGYKILPRLIFGFLL